MEVRIKTKTAKTKTILKIFSGFILLEADRDFLYIVICCINVYMSLISPVKSHALCHRSPLNGTWSWFLTGLPSSKQRSLL